MKVYCVTSKKKTDFIYSGFEVTWSLILSEEQSTEGIFGQNRDEVIGWP
jgi:hypothetical protein